MATDTLVMTATFRADHTLNTVIRQEDERILHYMCALVSWARARHVERIVLGENSNTRFNFSKIASFLEAAGKQLEVLVFDGNKEAAQRGKGFGEGEILEHVFTNSRLIRESGSFYKVTGRIFIGNFDEIHEQTPGPNAIHRKIRKPGKPSKANTVFFKLSLPLFESNLLHAYRQVDEPNGVYFEHVYFNQLRDVEAPDFSLDPRLVGQQASTGKRYQPYEADVIEAARVLI